MRLAVCGIDGLFPGFPAAFEDDLPNLSRIRREGLTATLLSTIPPYTPQAWTTMLTGVNPGAHGIAGFTLLEGGREVLLDRTAIRAPALGDYLEAEGVRAGFLNVPLTFPAPRARGGFTVAGMLAPHARAAGFAWPPECAERLLRAVPGYIVDTAVSKKDAAGEGVWDALEAMLSGRVGAVRALLCWEGLDVFFPVFVALDRAFHLAFRLLDPSDALFSTARGERIRARLSPLLRELDGCLGEIAARSERVLVVSDHGFRREEGKFYANRFLAGEGFLQLREGTLRGLADLCLATLGRERLRRFLPRRAIERALRASRAAVPQDAPAFAAPLAAQGIFVADPALRKIVTDRVRALRDPRDGSPLASGVFARDEIYRGAAIDRFPDIVLELKGGGIEVSPHIVGPDALAFAPDDWPGGLHDRRGVMTVWGRGVRRESTTAELEMADVLPTALALLGLPLPAALEGRPIEWEAGPRAGGGEREES